MTKDEEAAVAELQAKIAADTMRVLTETFGDSESVTRGAVERVVTDMLDRRYGARSYRTELHYHEQTEKDRAEHLLRCTVVVVPRITFTLNVEGGKKDDDTDD